MWNLFAIILLVSGIVIALSLMAYAFEHPRGILNLTRKVLKRTYEKTRREERRACKYCGSTLGENLTHCPNCGAPVYD